MSEPLVIQFAADTSRATSAMQSLAASIAGNMASAGVALSGLAANSNATGNSLGALQQNLTRAATALGNDVKNIATATANAATAEKATLEGVVRSFTAAAAGSQTASATVQAGVTGTSTAISTLASQIPTLRTLLGVFIAFEAAKLIFTSVSASIEAAREHIAGFVKIGKEAERAGVGPEFFQRVTVGAEKYGLTVEQATQALTRFRDASNVKLGEGKGAKNTSQLGDSLQQDVLAGNITAGDRQSVVGAKGTEAQFRALLDIIQKLKDAGKDLVAFDLAGKFISPEFEKQLRSGQDAVTKLKATINSTSTTVAGIRIIDPAEVERANQLDLKAKDLSNTLASALAPIQKDISSSVIDTYDTYLRVATAIAGVVKVASNLYVTVRDTLNLVDKFATKIPVIGQIFDLGKDPFSDLRIAAQKLGFLPKDGAAPGTPSVTMGEIEVRGRNRGNPRPGVTTRAPRGGGDTESLDAVETLINQIEKARDTAKAELENVAKTNVERERAVALAKAEAAAREEFQKGKRSTPGLDDDERTRVQDAAGQMQKYRDATRDAEQALRQSAEAARYFGDAASNGLADAILEGKSFSSVLNDISKQVFRVGLQGFLTGQGPLAGLLGTAPKASSGDTVGGIAGLANSLFGGFKANGGPVEAGRAYTVGEAGREMFVPNQNGQIVPIGKGGSGSSGPVIRMGDINISAPGADREGLMQLRSYVDAARREDRRLIGQSLASWKENN
ncbi:hypothetical protein [Methylobacterium flocculans]|uniref:hypothetical protein n=1 Tax=Methylobacterium flocculans TaxID=2984843 RepID=UPI0021F27A3D|nr:hypothetical protein [Methylobacterium sp. FF17]